MKSDPRKQGGGSRGERDDPIGEEEEQKDGMGEEEDPMAVVQLKLKELKSGFWGWLSEQSPPFEDEVMEKLRAQQDLKSAMFSAFGAGAIISMLSGSGSAGERATDALFTGVVLAILQGGLMKLSSKWLGPEEEDKYVETRCMLRRLGLTNYLRNFKNGLLTDHSLPFLNDSVLKEVNVPPGPRLVILGHVLRDPKMIERRRHFSSAATDISHQKYV